MLFEPPVFYLIPVYPVSNHLLQRLTAIHDRIFVEIISVTKN